MRNPLILLLLTTLTISAAASDPIRLRRIATTPASGVTYTLRDDFTDTLAAGSVNGTSATPGPGTRTVDDTSSDTITVGSGYLNFALVPAATWGDNLYSLTSLSRGAGKLCYFEIYPTNAFDGMVGFMSNQTSPASGSDIDFESVLRFATSASTAYWEYDTVSKSIGVYSTSDTDYVIALRATGAFLFVGGKLRYIAYDNSTATLYPSAANAGNGFGVDSVRIPSGVTWLPTPTASDGFGSAGALSTTDGLGHAETSGVGAGGGSVTWTGGFYSSGSAAYCTNLTATDTTKPTNGTFETGDPPSDWSAVTSTLSAETSDVYAGSQSLKVARNGNNNFFADQNFTFTNGIWYRISVYGKRVDASAIRLYIGSDNTSYTVTAYTLLKTTFARTTGAETIRLMGQSSGADGVSVLFDNAKIEVLTLSELLQSVTASSAYSYCGVGYTQDSVNSNLTGGIFGNLDSTSSPANFWVAFHTNNKIYCYQYVAGVQSSFFNTGATYSAGARIEAITYLDGSDMKIRVYYNKAYVNGATLNAALKTNTKFGIFSTDDSLRFDNFVVYPTGESGEHSATLNKY